MSEIKSLLDEGLAGFQPVDQWFVRVLERVRRRQRRHRIGAALVAFILVGTAAVGLWYSFSPLTGRPAGKDSLGTYRDSRFDWTFRYPIRMQTGHFEGGGEFEVDGQWVANFSAGITGTCCPSPNMSRFRNFPPDGVAFMLWFGQRLPVRPLQDSQLPLSLSMFAPSQPYVGGAEPHPLYLSFAADGTYFSAAVWFGPRASSVDRSAIADVIASIRFPSLRPGTWADGRWVIGPASPYPVGSITGFIVPGLQGLPSVAYYLAHAPSGFAVVPQQYVHGTTKCGVVVLAGSFACQEPSLRWDLTGHLEGGADATDMACVPPATTFDGMLLVGTFLGDASDIGNHCG
jgi:hypothetical protein